METINLLNLKGKTALVTGASQGIGRSIAIALAQAGANVIINYRTNDELAQGVAAIVSTYGVRPYLWKYDLLSDNVSEDFKAFKDAESISVDVLVLNASLQIRKEWDKISISEFSSQMTVNVRSSLELVQCCVPDMEKNKWGRILTIGSVQQKRPNFQMIVYAASKAAQMNMVMSLASILGNKGITVNNLAPGVIATSRNEEVLKNAIYKEKILSTIPVNRIGEPDDIASMALLLCSDAGSYINGSDIYVDGGMNLPG